MIEKRQTSFITNISFVKSAHICPAPFRNKAKGRGFRCVVGWIFFSVITGIYLSSEGSVWVYKWLINCAIEKSFLLLCFFYDKVAICFTQKLILQIYQRMASKSAGVIAGCLYLGVIKAEPDEPSRLFKQIELAIALLCWLPCPWLAVQVFSL